MSPDRISALTAPLLGASIAAGLALAGCGGAPSDRAAIERTFAAIQHGFLTGDGRAVCAKLTEAEITTIAGEGARVGGGGSCSAAVALATEDLGPDGRDRIRRAKIETLTIRGDRATATDSSGGGPDRFQRIDGRWYLSGGLE